MTYTKLVMLADSPDHIRSIAPVANRLVDEFASTVVGISSIESTITERRLIEQLPADAAQRYRAALTAARTQLKSTFELEIDKNQGRRSWVEGHGDADVDIQREMLYADIALVSKPAGKSIEAYPGIVHQILMDSFKPTIVCPDQYEQDIFETVCIAWNSTAQVARAVNFALPILKRAKRVRILGLSSVDDRDSQKHEATRLHSYLAGHGVSSEIDVQVVDSVSGAAFVAELDRLDATFAVMGAWGHTRLRELVLGGFTRFAIRNARCPLFMAH